MDNNLNVIDLFSGAGGLSLGFKNVGYNIILANEYDEMIARSYQYNNPETLMINKDIKHLVENFDEIIAEEIMKNPQFKNIEDSLSSIDVVVGGPPCQGFSMAGGRIRKYNEFIEDPRNFLFKYYFEIIKKFEPNFFVFENVEGILSSSKGEIIKTIVELFNDENNFRKGGYHLSINKLNAYDFGVAQTRKRVIIFGSKNKIDFNSLMKDTFNKLPVELQEYFSVKATLKDVIFDLSEVDANNVDNGFNNHTSSKHNDIAINRMKKVKPDENWQTLNENIKSVHSGAYGRLSWDKPATTITTRFDTPSAGRYIHPVHNRTITPREAARIQSFPDDYIFLGNKTSICKQIGNAVPPKLAQFLAYMILNANNKL